MLKKLIITLFSLFIIQSLAIAQTISGIVKDDNGNPIEHALVRHENNASIWAKTDDDGKFSISGSTGTKLRFSALHKQTKRNVNVNNASNFNVKLQDNVLESTTDVFHVSFDEVRPGPSTTHDEIRDYFHTFYSKGCLRPGDPGSDRTSIDPNVSIDAGGQSLKVLLPKGKLKTNDSGIDLKLPLSGTTNDNTFIADDLYVSYWIKMSDNFDWPALGGKLPSLGGSDPYTRDNEWKGRIMWGQHGTIRFYPELKHGDQGFDDSVREDLRWWGTEPNNENGLDEQINRTSFLKEDGWHNIELHYLMDNGVGTTGYFEGWIDGMPMAEKRRSSDFGYWRAGDNKNITINTLKISVFAGGSSTDYEPKVDQYMWFDEFRVSRNRINEYSKYMGPLQSKDCNNEVNGSAEIDQCGVCSGGSTGKVPNATCKDCNNEINGTAEVDACGVCSGGTTGKVTNATCNDCNQTPNGTALVDECGVCSGGTTGIPVDECRDCNTVFASTNDGNVPENTLDNNLNTRWSAEGVGQYVEYCLTDVKALESISIAFARGNERTATFDVMATLDGVNYTNVISDQVTSGNTLEKETYSLGNQSFWKLRIVGKGNSKNAWNSISEVSWEEATTVAVESSTPVDQVNLFPNPVADVLYFNGDNEYNWELESSNGVELTKGKGNNCDMTNLPSGVYILLLEGRAHRVIKN